MFAWSAANSQSSRPGDPTDPSSDPPNTQETPQDYTAALAHATEQCADRTETVNALLSSVETERETAAAHLEAIRVAEAELSQILASTAEMESQRDDLAEQVNQLRNQTENLQGMLERSAAERDERRRETEAMEAEVKEMELASMKYTAEMQQLKVFEVGYFKMIDRLKMNNQMLLTDKDQTDLDLRDLKLEVEKLKVDLLATKVERDRLEKDVDEAEAQHADSKVIAQLRAFENDNLHLEHDTLKTTQAPLFFGSTRSSKSSIWNSLSRKGMNDGC